MKPLLLVLVLLLPLNLSGEILRRPNPALDAFKRGDYATAYQEWLPLAKRGNAKAQFLIGLMHEYGRHVSKDNTEAAKWYRHAAWQGMPEAEYRLGVMYALGKGTAQDYVQAYAWFNLSAWHGYKKAAKALDVVLDEMTPAQIAKGEKLSGVMLEGQNEKK